MQSRVGRVSCSRGAGLAEPGALSGGQLGKGPMAAMTSILSSGSIQQDPMSTGESPAQ